MVQRAPDDYRIDPDDPRAPSQAAWDRMSQEERERVVATLPVDVPIELYPPEGDAHRKAKSGAVEALDGFFRRMGRKVYVSSELTVYYPNEPRFVPDILAVTDVEPHDRDSWIVSKEGKGLDFVIEVHRAGDRAKDFTRNVERYARLGIPEYFVFDVTRAVIRAFHLRDAPKKGKGAVLTYVPLLPRLGRFTSRVLGLDLAVEDGRLRFLVGLAPVPQAEELIAKLGSMVDDVIERQRDAETRAEAEAKRADDLARELKKARAEIARMKRRQTKKA